MGVAQTRANRFGLWFQLPRCHCGMFDPQTCYKQKTNVHTQPQHNGKLRQSRGVPYDGDTQIGGFHLGYLLNKPKKRGPKRDAPFLPPPPKKNKIKISSGDIPNSMWNPGGTLVEPWWNPGGTLQLLGNKRTNNSQNPRGTPRDAGVAEDAALYSKATSDSAISP